jgi:hypothetical protein
MVGDDRIFLMVGDCYAQVDAKVRSCDSGFLMEGDCCTLLDRHFRASYTFMLSCLYLRAHAQLMPSYLHVHAIMFPRGAPI